MGNPLVFLIKPKYICIFVAHITKIIMPIFYHITTPEQWTKFKKDDFYASESLTTEGFIHASFAEQVDKTLSIHFKNIPKVYILTIESDLLTSELIIEPSRDGALFPHIYGPINKSAIVKMEGKLLFNVKNS
jgi:uncharacterized protein (DUF952 family)